jgi:hypothetical protein
MLILARLIVRAEIHIDGGARTPPVVAIAYPLDEIALLLPKEYPGGRRAVRKSTFESRGARMALVMVAKEESVPKIGLDNQGQPNQGSQYFVPRESGDINPQGHTVFVANRTLRAHFHEVDQFQILLGAPGSLYQRTPIPALMLHYADAFSTYGPMIGTDPPLRFFTLRAQRSKATWYMPKDREHLRYRGSRHFLVTPDEFTAPMQGEIATKVLIEQADDGLEALDVSGGAGATMLVEPSKATSGQYIFVADGSLAFDGKTYGPESLGWQDASDESAKLQAGSDGCRILVLRYPCPSTTVGQPSLAKVANLT